MNAYRRGIAGAWALAAGAGLAAIAAWSTAAPSMPRATLKTYPLLRSPTPLDTTGLAAAAAQLRDRDPFRWERKPTTVRYNPWEPLKPAEPNVSSKPSRPPLALVGILGGPPWTALLEGIPGRVGGALLRVGEEAGGIRLLDVRGDTVRLSGLDTTWVLTPRRPWR